MTKIKTGIIGTGFIGPAHVEALRRLGFVEVVAVAERGDELAAAKAALRAQRTLCIIRPHDLSTFADFFMRSSVADMVHPLEGGNDLFVMGDDDDGSLELARHVIENANDCHGSL